MEKFRFEATVQFHDTAKLTILNLNLDLGSSTLDFKNAPVIIKLIQWMFNLKWPTTFLVNKVLPFIANIFLGRRSLELSIPLFYDYFLDVTPVGQIKNNINDTTVLHSAFEVYSTRKGRQNVISPKNLDNEINKDNSVEIAMNNYTISTLITSLAANNELGIKLTDELVFNATQLLHLRANTFSYFIPGLKKYGEKPLTLDIKFNESIAVDVKEENNVTISGSAKSDFYLEGVKNAVVKMESMMLFGFALNLKGKEASAELSKIIIKSLTFIECIEPKPDPTTIMNEFNALFRVIVGAISNYVLNKKFDIQKILDNIPFVKITVNDLSLELEKDRIKMGGKITIK